MKPESKTIQKTNSRLINIVLLFIIYSTLFAVNSYGQSITWQRLYNTPVNNQSVSKATCMADNGNFYSGGTVLINNQWDIYVMKLNPLGDTIWTRIIDTLATEVLAMTSTGDGGCIIVGDNHFSIKFDTMGNIVWAKYYSGEPIGFYDIIKTNDGGYIACGIQVNLSTLARNGYLMKLDVNGVMQWQQIYPTNDIKELNSVIQLSNGNYAIAGTNSDYLGDTVKILLLKVNSTGSIYLNKKYTVLNKIAFGLSLNQINDQYIIGGGTVTIDSTGTYNSACFIRTDSSGNFLFAKRYDANRNQGFYDMKVINSNKYIFTRTRSFINMPLDSYVMIIDSLGNAFNEQSFSLPGFVIFRSILLMPNGDFIFAGNGRNTIQSPYKTFIVRADSGLYAPPIGIGNIFTNTPENFILKQNYPNPFNGTTIIEFEINKHSGVEIKIFDVLGKYVTTLLNKQLGEGSHKIHFDAGKYASGVYFVTLIAGDTRITRKLILIK